MILGNGEFALNGFRFGCGHSNIGVSTLQATSIRWRVQDQPNPVGDNILTGRDYGDPQPIKLGVFFSGDTAEEVARLRRSSLMLGPQPVRVNRVKIPCWRLVSTVKR